MKIIEYRKFFYISSLTIILLGFCVAMFNVSQGKGLFNYDTDFIGGTSLTFDLGQDVEVADVEKISIEASGQSSPRVQKIVGSNQVTVKMQTLKVEQRKALTEKLVAKYPKAVLLAYSDITATVSSEMKQKALTAVAIACAAMLLYISIRFKDLKMGSAAILALLHDIVIMVIVYLVFRIPVNNSFIAAVLTILGYSINATIVIFDRIRENRRLFKRNEQDLLINKSVTQTLARSINTSVTVLLSIIAVYYFGVTSVREFAFPIIIGVVVGTYSSVFFSGSLWYTFCEFAKQKKTA